MKIINLETNKMRIVSIMILLLFMFVSISGCNNDKKYCSDVKSTIIRAKTEMESSFAVNQKYPRQIPWLSSKPENGVTVELISVDDMNYSMKASHPKCGKIMLTTSGETGIIEQSR